MIDRSRLTVGSQRCELPDEELYDFGNINPRYDLECTAGDETSEPGFYNASVALEKWWESPGSYILSLETPPCPCCELCLISDASAAAVLPRVKVRHSPGRAPGRAWRVALL